MLPRRSVADQAGVEALAAGIAALLRPGDAILLEGPLGAGKTTFARALIRAACGAPALDVPSPSYTLVQTYEAARLRIHHFDLWRLEGPDSLPELGWEDALADVVVVEWPERLGGLRPAGALVVTLRPAGETGREIAFGGWEARQGKEGLIF
jgi:tRNA threonylcarbamoyladenosine biosynthesis protein TsaE